MNQISNNTQSNVCNTQATSKRAWVNVSMDKEDKDKLMLFCKKRREKLAGFTRRVLFEKAKVLEE